MPESLDAPGLSRLLARPGVSAVLAALDAPSEETRLVGGCVRDALLGRDVSDIDLATTLLPADTMARAERAGLKAVPTGIDHGTVTVIADGDPFEVTTLREDIETDGRHAVVRFGRDFVRDAKRRDFTMNALSLGPDGSLYDLTGGLADLAEGRVRFIGDPDTRIREDALRVLRFFRFHARFGADAPDAAGLDACIRARDALDGLSRERVRAEFLKTLMTPGAVAAIETLSRTGLLTRLIAGICDLGRLDRAARAGLCVNGRLAAGFVLSTVDAERLRLRLRLSNAEFAVLVAYARALAALLTPEAIDAAALRALAAEHGAPTLGRALTALDGERRPALSPEARALLPALLDPSAARPVMPLTGADLVALGLMPGPRIGQALAAARRLWLARGCPTDAAAREDLIATALGADAARQPEPGRKKPAGPG
ncbi:CCA tRNA nucleotidyltransferase [Methylobacterium oxalidis]|uniref:CCA tRNA nucleotidyltransferase n=1 Tax=Methylobacterium oxalidis TaxID=944322 RepID=UPI0011BDD9A5|nr:CCA tRNA nucleotidyltransferase [Methylobacterium oxalidis]